MHRGRAHDAVAANRRLTHDADAARPSPRRCRLPGDADAHAARRSARRVIAVVLLVGVVVVGTWVVAFSPVLGAKRRARAWRARRCPRHRYGRRPRSGHGAPLVRLDTGAVAGRVDALPEVASAHVRVSYPSTVVITVDRADRGRLPRPQEVRRSWWTRAERSSARSPRRLAACRGSTSRAVRGQCAAGRAVATVAAALTPALLAKLKSIKAARSAVDHACCSPTAAPCAGGVPTAAPTRRECFPPCSRVRAPHSTSATRTRRRPLTRLHAAVLRRGANMPIRQGHLRSAAREKLFALDRVAAARLLERRRSLTTVASSS